MDYRRIYNEKKIIEKQILTHHDLNLIVFQPSEENPFRGGEKRIKITAKFEYAYQKWNAKEALMYFGEIKPLRKMGKKYIKYFSTDYSTEKESYIYSTNNGLVLSESWSQLDDKY